MAIAPQAVKQGTETCMRVHSRTTQSKTVSYRSPPAQKKKSTYASLPSLCNSFSISQSASFQSRTTSTTSSCICPAVRRVLHAPIYLHPFPHHSSTLAPTLHTSLVSGLSHGPSAVERDSLSCEVLCGVGRYEERRANQLVHANKRLGPHRHADQGTQPGGDACMAYIWRKMKRVGACEQ